MPSPEQQAAFGRKIAEAQGYSPNDPGIDYVAYGRAATYHLGRRQGVPNPAEFRTGPAPIVASTGAAKARHVIRIGRVEMSLADEPLARNRPQRTHHRGQRTTGYYRYRTRAVKGHLLKPGDRLLVQDVVTTVLRHDPPTTDRFGRTLNVLWARREDTGQEGRMLYGSGGSFRKIEGSNRRKKTTAAPLHHHKH